MSLLRNVGTIGGLTLVSRFAGLAREMIFSRVLGANAVTDAWFQAFIIPNVFRRMFAEGAFSAAFVPMFSKRLHGDGGIEEARSFSNDVLSVFLPVLIAVCAVMMLAMPLVIRLLGDGDSSPANFAMEVDFARIMFPYIALVSMVTLFTGMLNSVSRFAPGASFPIILNLVLIANLLIGDHAISQWGWTTRQVGYTQAWAVTVGGAIQLAWLYYWTRVEGFRPKLLWPRITPEVKRLSIIAFPAAIGGGAYQINTLVQLYFLNQLDSGSISYMNYADRLNQLPLGIIGIALSTAILPTLSKFVGAKNRAGTDRIQSDAIELAMLLTIPAAVALAICAEPFVTMIFQGGRFSLEQAALTGNVLAALVLGLPAYVLVKVFQPAFFSREDTRTPVFVAAGALAINIALNFYVVPRYGIVGLAAATAITATLNVLTLYAILQIRGWFHVTGKLAGRIVRQIIATTVMGALLWWMTPALEPYWRGSAFDRIWSLAALVIAGAGVFFATAYVVGALDKDLIAQLRRKRAVPASDGPPNLSE